MNQGKHHSIRSHKLYGNNRPPFQAKPRNDEVTLRIDEFVVERKTFVFLLRENSRGRFLRIIEQLSGRPSTSVIIPSGGLLEFQKVLAEMVQT